MPGSDDRTRAFVYDLTIAPLWCECFDRLLTETVSLPASGRILLVECGTGGLAIELAHRLRETGTVTASDSNPARLQIARDKCQVAQLDNLYLIESQELVDNFTEDGYDLVVGDASLLPTTALEPMLAMLRERVGEDGQAVVYVVSRGSFDEFFSVLWEALYECDLAETLATPLEALLHTYPTLSDLSDQAAAVGLRGIHITVGKEIFKFDSGQDFLDSPLIAGYWLDRWLAIVPPAHIETVKASLQAIIDRDCGAYPFEVSIKAALLVGRIEPPYLTDDEDEADEEAADDMTDDDDKINHDDERN
ncbi:MAG: methyltransferase domain-containing protein [Chloracidobacterium sp.]|uniref:Methyltransferase domain-containing protein n=1 Tax=Chloracidobacterium validum TaxID=2821543 RepID=A0ABX8B9M6_9BACT|nr:methyltransferase domain-containing protein [Chloracidobacterium validum]QUW02380.1 methyltransferase domain-containing protein [Chloracidobacterium validum]